MGFLHWLDGKLPKAVKSRLETLLLYLRHRQMSLLPITVVVRSSVVVDYSHVLLNNNDLVRRQAAVGWSQSTKGETPPQVVKD